MLRRYPPFEVEAHHVCSEDAHHLAWRCTHIHVRTCAQKIPPHHMLHMSYCVLDAIVLNFTRVWWYTCVPSHFHAVCFPCRNEEQPEEQGLDLEVLKYNVDRGGGEATKYSLNLQDAFIFSCCISPPIPKFL